MARIKAFKTDKIKENRNKSGMNQSQYWSRFGVTQSGGSRYESGRAVPTPTKILMWLVESGRITDTDLIDAMKAVKVKA
jgi:DNA-binding transcriptional regulator YiaG